MLKPDALNVQKLGEKTSHNAIQDARRSHEQMHAALATPSGLEALAMGYFEIPGWGYCGGWPKGLLLAQRG